MKPYDIELLDVKSGEILSLDFLFSRIAIWMRG